MIPGPKSRRIFAAVTVLGSSALALVCGEVALRIREKILLKRMAPTSWAGDYGAYLQVSHQADRMFVRDPEDREIPYRNRPGFRMDFPLPSGKTWSCSINSLGFRGPEFSPRKPAGTFRILCLGGSTTFWGYSDGETYPALLDARLSSSTPGDEPVEVLNLGVSGYTSAMNAERFRREYRFWDPDLVLVLHGINDICTLAPSHDYHRLGRSLLLATVRNLIVAWSAETRKGTLESVVAASFETRIAPAFDRLREEAERAGARLAVCTYPGPELSLLTEGDRRFLEAEIYRSWRNLEDLRTCRAALDVYNQKLREWGARRGVAVLELARRVRGGTDIYMDIAHMNTLGLEKVATVIAEELLQRGWLQGGPRRSAAAHEARAEQNPVAVREKGF